MLSKGTYTIEYAGKDRQGTGNISDSDIFESLEVCRNEIGTDYYKPYNIPKKINGELLAGNLYNLSNFLSNFYITLIVE